jgi:hypothetical protein
MLEAERLISAVSLIKRIISNALKVFPQEPL